LQHQCAMRYNGCYKISHQVPIWRRPLLSKQQHDLLLFATSSLRNNKETQFPSLKKKLQSFCKHRFFSPGSRESKQIKGDLILRQSQILHTECFSSESLKPLFKTVLCLHSFAKKISRPNCGEKHVTHLTFFPPWLFVFLFVKLGFFCTQHSLF